VQLRNQPSLLFHKKRDLFFIFDQDGAGRIFPGIFSKTITSAALSATPRNAGINFLLYIEEANMMPLEPKKYSV
jgi:hypothetical protein